MRIEKSESGMNDSKIVEKRERARLERKRGWRKA
jgi:hypothetical protein